MKKLFICPVLIILFIFAGCFTDDEGTKKYNITFKVDGVEKSYSSREGWGFDYNVNADTWFCIWGGYGENDGADISLPGSVFSGSSFDQNSADFDFYLTQNGELYAIRDQFFSLTVTQWSDEGGIVKGTFSGTLSSGSVYVDITDGTFEAENNGDYL